MKSSTIEKLCEFKDKFGRFFVHKKKLKALSNYSSTLPIEKNHKTAIKLIETFADAGFLEEEDVTYLNHLLERYEVKFTEWAHKTKWLQQHMKKLADEKRGVQPKPQYKEVTIFEFMEKKKSEQVVSVPLEILAQQSQAKGLHV